jgi:ubiquitin-protein ligase/DNA-directed RNA polymerase subunit RPC12/RpoP
MIQFSCRICGRQFNVPDKHANRKAVCKTCGHPLVVPASTPPVESMISRPVVSSAPPVEKSPVEQSPVEKVPVRTRRLLADLDQIRRSFTRDSLIRLISVQGNPAEIYTLEFAVRGVEKLKSKQPVYRDLHRVEVRLTRDYPRLAPMCRMMTPIFHPNIDTSAICIGDHWTAGERLADLIVRIAEMIGYQAYNIKSPLNAEAAMWADLNREKIPTDSRDLHPAALERVS